MIAQRTAAPRIAAALLACSIPSVCLAAAQQPPQPAESAPTTATASHGSTPSPAQKRPASAKDRRRATRLFLLASKQFQNEQFAEAMQNFEQAAQLDPGNANYAASAKLARSHLVVSLIQQAAKAQVHNDSTAALAALQQAEQLDPGNPQVAEHLRGLAAKATADLAQPLYDQAADTADSVPEVEFASGLQSFHLRTDRRQLIQQVFRAYGVEATLDSSVPAVPVRFDLDKVDFQQATRILGMATNSFWVPLDAHRALVATDTHLNRQQFERLEVETVYLSGMSADQMTAVANIAKGAFNAQQAVITPSLGTLTVRAPASSLDAFNTMLRDLLDGHSQVLLDVRLIQLANTNTRITGLQFPQQITAFNVYAEEQSILNANQALVQQIISSGLASPGDTLAILGILLAAGQIPSSIFSNGIALFGGGLTLSGVVIGPTTLSLNLNSSATRILDQMQVRLSDGQEGTLRDGLRYPITTSTFSGVFTNGINIPGLTSAGTSASLNSLLASYAGAGTTVPQIQYQDLGMTLKATPSVMRNGDVALSLDLKISALAGPAINGIPVLSNRNFSGVVTLREGAGVVLVSELDKQESQALSGTPGLSEIPGLNNLSNKDLQLNYATLVIIVTPHVVSGPQMAGHSPMLRIARGTQAAP